jgi:hypothetical protein
MAMPIAIPSWLPVSFNAAADPALAGGAALMTRSTLSTTIGPEPSVMSAHPATTGESPFAWLISSSPATATTSPPAMTYAGRIRRASRGYARQGEQQHEDVDRDQQGGQCEHRQTSPLPAGRRIVFP